MAAPSDSRNGLIAPFHRWRRAAAVAAYMAGEPVKVICQRHGIKQTSTVYEWLLKKGIEPTRKKAKAATAAKVRELAEQGMTDREIAERLGLSRGQAYGICRRHNIPLAIIYPRIPDDVKQAAVDLYEAGKTYDEIAAACGIDRGHLSKIFHKAGVVFRVNRPDHDLSAPRRQAKLQEVARLHAEGFYDREIAARLGVGRTSVGRARTKLGLAANYVGWSAALALMLLAGGAQAQQSGWQGHPHQTPDPFMQMKTGDGRSCCSSVDSAYTDDCVTVGKNEPGVIGPDGQCHALTEAALKTKNCAPGGTSACFYKGQMLCACTSGT